MAACSSTRLEEKLDEKCAASLVFSSLPPFQRNIEGSNRLSITVMQKNESINEITSSKKETADVLAKLSEDELQKLLEEAVTFNRPSSTDSYLLQRLKLEHTDTCGDATKHSMCHGVEDGVSQSTNITHFLNNKKNLLQLKNFHNCGSEDSFSGPVVTSCDHSVKHEQSCVHENSREVDKIQESIDSNPQSFLCHSLQDLYNSRLSEQTEFMRAAGIGRGIKSARPVRTNQFTHFPLTGVVKKTLSNENKDESSNSLVLKSLPIIKSNQSVELSELCDKSCKEYLGDNCDGKILTNKNTASEENISVNLHTDSYSKKNKDSSLEMVKLTSKTLEDNSSCCDNVDIDNCSFDKSKSSVQSMLYADTSTAVEHVKIQENQLQNSIRCLSKEVEKTCTDKVSMCEKTDKSPVLKTAMSENVDSMVSQTCNVSDKRSNRSAEVDEKLPISLQLIYSKSTDPINDLKVTYVHGTSIGKPECISWALGNHPSVESVISGVGCSSIQPKKEEKVQKHKKKSFLPEGPEETRSFFQDINGNPSFRSENFLTTFHPSKRDKISNCIDSLLPKQDKTLSKLKSKRSKLNTENNNVVLAESIAGYRGHEPVDSLVAYITGNTDSVTNSDILHPKSVFGCLDVEQKREKIVNKDYKNLTNNKDLFVDSTKKKHLGVDENDLIDNEEHKQVLTDQCGNLLNIPYSNCAKELVTQDVCVVSSTSIEDQPCVKSSGNVEAELNRVAVTSFSSGLETSGRQELSSFVKDFYSVTEGHSELIEDSDFHVVKKKRKKYRQTKKFLSSFRRYNYVAGESRERDCNSDQTARNNSLTLNLPISQQGSDKPDHTCWKYASSVPHSEHSSPENSDLDSVHSLPIHISPTLNSTVAPSLSLSSSHASYAEIARLSSSNKSKLNSIPANKSTNSYLLPEVHSQKSCKLGPQVSENVGLELNFGVELSILNSTSVYPPHSEQAQFSSNSNVSNSEKTSERKPNKIVDKVTSNVTNNLFGKDKKREKIETTIIDGKPQIYSSNMTVKHTNLSSGPVVLGFSENNDVTKTRESSNIDGCSLNKTMAIHKIMKRVKKLDLNGRKQQFSEEMSHNLPVIIMDNCLPSGNVCGLTFGFEINELLVQMALDKATNQDGIIKSEDTTVEKLSKAGDFSHNPLEAQNLQKQVPVNPIHSLPNHDISQPTDDEASSPSQVTIPTVPCKQDPISGPSPQWIEPQENPKCFNYDQIVSFFGLAWENVQKEYQKDASDDNRAACNKIKYYSK